jgi:SAM-dependent methyltransferase
MMSTAETFAEWLLTTHGKYVLEREQNFIDQSVADVFGFNAMQIGLPQYDLLRTSRIPLRIKAGTEPGAEVRLNVDELPFACDSLDLVILPHLLEFNEHPHQILREVERIMLPEGHVIITGFNPRSLWGLRRALGPKQDYPWRGKFISLPRIKDWLALLGFEVVVGRFSCYAPPLTNAAWLKRLRFMEPAGDRWWAVCGGVYMLMAIKRVPGMRLIKPQWNGRLVEQLLPVRPKLNNRMPQKTRTDTQ